MNGWWDMNGWWILLLCAVNVWFMHCVSPELVEFDNGDGWAVTLVGFVLLFPVILAANVVTAPVAVGIWVAIVVATVYEKKASTSHDAAGMEKQAAKARRIELGRQQCELEWQQRLAAFGAEGARLYEQAAAAVAQIAGSEAARAGWLGDPSDFDFRSDLAAMAANLRRAEEIRKVRGEGLSIMHLTAADEKMLEDAGRAISALENAAKERSRLIGECALQAADIDTQLADDRERGVSAKRREDLRNRLGPMLYGTQNMPAEMLPSESADVVKARAAAFRELRGVLRNYRLDSQGA